MNKRHLLTAVFTALISLPLAVYGADEPKKKGDGFKTMDTNKDGKVSKQEFLAAHKAGDNAKAESHFKALDVNGDGFLTAEELNASQKAKKAKKG